MVQMGVTPLKALQGLSVDFRKAGFWPWAWIRAFCALSRSLRELCEPALQVRFRPQLDISAHPGRRAAWFAQLGICQLVHELPKTA